jgi:hypothetical protein
VHVIVDDVARDVVAGNAVPLGRDSDQGHVLERR